MKVDKPRNSKLKVSEANILEALILCASDNNKLSERGKKLLEDIVGKRVAKQILEGNLELIHEADKIFRSTKRDNDSRGLPDKE